MRVAIPGGAGFIGSHTADGLIARGHDVVILDSVDPQVHPSSAPEFLNESAEFIQADVRDRIRLAECVRSADAVLFLAAAVGVGQSMYEVHRYVETNSMGIATLLDILATAKHDVQKLVVASSMSIYGEGAYRCEVCGPVEPALRTMERLEARIWELPCPVCSRELTPIPTPETKRLDPQSVYAITKRDHEELGLRVGAAYEIPTMALRYFNCYGQRQALSNPYTGAVAIFARSMLAGTPPVVYEDGQQSRDFIHVDDIVQANILALESTHEDSRALNVGTGEPTSINRLIEALAEVLGYDGDVIIEERFRSGDIRHCYADITTSREILGFAPRVRLHDGLKAMLDWLTAQAVSTRLPDPHEELAKRGLLR